MNNESRGCRNKQSKLSANKRMSINNTIVVDNSGKYTSAKVGFKFWFGKLYWKIRISNIYVIKTINGIQKITVPHKIANPTKFIMMSIGFSSSK